jgi:hypothetical protein
MNSLIIFTLFFAIFFIQGLMARGLSRLEGILHLQLINFKINNELSGVKPQIPSAPVDQSNGIVGSVGDINPKTDALAQNAVENESEKHGNDQAEGMDQDGHAVDHDETVENANKDESKLEPVEEEANKQANEEDMDKAANENTGHVEIQELLPIDERTEKDEDGTEAADQTVKKMP